MQRYMSGFCLQNLAQKPDIYRCIGHNSDRLGFYAEIPFLGQCRFERNGCTSLVHCKTACEASALACSVVLVVNTESWGVRETETACEGKREREREREKESKGETFTHQYIPMGEVPQHVVHLERHLGGGGGGGGGVEPAPHHTQALLS